MLPPEHPCHGCRAHRRGHTPQQEIKAACCWDSTIVVDAPEYLTLFYSHYLANTVAVEEDLRHGEMFFLVSLLGACPHLETETGLCTIHDHKPLACRQAVPEKFSLCIKSKDYQGEDA